MRSKVCYILIILLMICLIPIRTFAGTAIDDVLGDGDTFISHADSADTVINTSKLQSFSGDVFNLILAIGMVIAVIVGIVLGIQFMISSVEEKAKVKEILIVYVIGCAVLFGAFTIWKIVIGILGNV